MAWYTEAQLDQTVHHISVLSCQVLVYLPDVTRKMSHPLLQSVWNQQDNGTKHVHSTFTTLIPVILTRILALSYQVLMSVFTIGQMDLIVYHICAPLVQYLLFHTSLPF